MLFISASTFFYPFWILSDGVPGTVSDIIEEFSDYFSYSFFGSGVFLLFFFYSADLSSILFSILQKWECSNPVNWWSSTDHAGVILLVYLAALTTAHAIRYWLVLTNLWSYKLSRTKYSIYFSISFEHFSSIIGEFKCRSLEYRMPYDINISTISKKEGELSRSKPILLRIVFSSIINSFFLLLYF